MTQTTTASTENIFFVAHGPDCAHFGTVKPGTAVTTGQPNLEEFSTLLEAGRRAYELQPDQFSAWMEDDAEDYSTDEFRTYNGELYLLEGSSTNDTPETSSDWVKA